MFSLPTKLNHHKIAIFEWNGVRVLVQQRKYIDYAKLSLIALPNSMSGIFQLQQTEQAVCFTSFVTITLDVNAVIGGNLNESRKIKGGGGCGRQLFQNNRAGSRNEMTHAVWLRTHLLQHMTSRHWLISSWRFEEMSFENLDDKCDIFLHNVENPPPSDIICFPRKTQSSRSNMNPKYRVSFLNLTTNTKLSDFSSSCFNENLSLNKH
jgi:hypothetical protein